MIDFLTNITALSADKLLLMAGVIFIAALVRGFSGFALSAVIMASLAVIIPPVQLIPICITLEGVAGLIMFRGGIKDANMKIVWGLVIGATIGLPFGLYATKTFPIETSKLIALILILSLTIIQLLKLKPKFLATKFGLYFSGAVAGIATGLASVGGMVVALYVLASNIEAKVMRASLVMYLLLGMATSVIMMLIYDIMTLQAFIRGLVFAPLCILGVSLGGLLFRPSLVGYYKNFCLLLLISLSLIGIYRLVY